jgi:hypothetical protein
MENNPFPKIEILPTPIERVIEVAQKVGRFIFGTQEVPLYMSDHYVKEHFEGQ